MKIIAVSGHKRNGKNTTYMLSKLLLDEDETGKVVKVGFADALKTMARMPPYYWNGLKDAAGRKLLQDLGVGKRITDPNYWVNQVRMKLIELRSGPYPPDVVFITDCRFVNEAEMLKSLGGVIWRVERPSIPNTDLHISETELDDYPFDYTMRAETLDDLLALVKFGLERQGLLA
jgi:hypothetical protein